MIYENAKYMVSKRIPFTLSLSKIEGFQGTGEPLHNMDTKDLTEEGLGWILQQYACRAIYRNNHKIHFEFPDNKILIYESVAPNQ